MEGNGPPLFCLLLKNTWQKLSRYYNQRLAAYDLSVPKALLLLGIAPDSGKNPRSLAKELDLENSSMTGLVDRLVKQGLVERHPDPNDRRGVLIFLTPRGITAREGIKALVEELDRKIQEVISTEDIKTFRRIMAVISKQIDNSR
ncbi:MAG TPA: MarR family transcriptional regulator [Bacillota bacterium]|nr:MarR family transcriptional regulator [Bacillota bacterium]